MEPDYNYVTQTDMQEKFKRQVVGKAIAGVMADSESVCLLLIDGTRIIIVGQILGVGIQDATQPVVVQ